MSAMQIPADRAATAHISFFMLVFLFVSLPQHCAVRTDEECGVRSAECGVRSTETEVLHRTLAPSFLISLRSYILLITLRLFCGTTRTVTRLFSPTVRIVPQSGDVLGKNLKKFFSAQNPPFAEKGQKSSTPLISLG